MRSLAPTFMGITITHYCLIQNNEKNIELSCEFQSKNFANPLCITRPSENNNWFLTLKQCTKRPKYTHIYISNSDKIPLHLDFHGCCILSIHRHCPSKTDTDHRLDFDSQTIIIICRDWIYPVVLLRYNIVVHYTRRW